ncbi:MAG TPA: hypothetical protein VII94_01425 [Candidatus Saccharimonadales bacterium]
MILIEAFREEGLALSEKGVGAMAKALREIFPSLATKDWEDNKIVGHFLVLDLRDNDCLQLLQLASKYAKLWIFS